MVCRYDHSNVSNPVRQFTLISMQIIWHISAITSTIEENLHAVTYENECLHIISQAKASIAMFLTWKLNY